MDVVEVSALARSRQRQTLLSRPVIAHEATDMKARDVKTGGGGHSLVVR